MRRYHNTLYILSTSVSLESLIFKSLHVPLQNRFIFRCPLSSRLTFFFQIDAKLDTHLLLNSSFISEETGPFSHTIDPAPNRPTSMYAFTSKPAFNQTRHGSKKKKKKKKKKTKPRNLWAGFPLAHISSL